MAVATLYYGTTFEVASLDANWTMANETHITSAKGIRIKSIWFVPSGANDVMVIRDGSATGPRMFYGIALNASEPIRWSYDGAIKKPYIQQSDLTLAASANARVIFDLGGYRA